MRSTYKTHVLAYTYMYMHAPHARHKQAQKHANARTHKKTRTYTDAHKHVHEKLRSHAFGIPDI